MSLKVNFAAHGKELTATYKAVLNGNEDINWGLFGYDKGTNDLKVLGSGGGGLEELEDEFNDGKIQYAFVRVIDPNTELPKLVLIGWCGEGVPEAKKGLFNSHFNEVSSFLKTDVEPAYIMKRIEESGGSKYSIHKEAPQRPEPILPVGSVYRREQIPDIAAMQRESARRAPIKPVGTTYQKTELPTPKPLGTRSTWATAEENKPSPVQMRLQREREEREREERENREREEKQREKEEERKRTERENREREERERRERNEREELERREREERERKEREEREWEDRADRERREREEREERERREREEREKREERERREREEREERERREQEERERREAEEEERREREEQERYEREEQERKEQEEREAELLQQQQEADSGYDHAAQPLSAVVIYAYDAGESNEMSLVEGEIITNIVQLDEGWWQGEGDDGKKSGLFPAYSHAGEEDSGYTAVALYAYTADEANEISFDEGAIITNITFESDDWWQGTAPDGSVGLFPANYVELSQE
ncbi:8724_t:CDS:10 [Paraglomus occultum]|uniref:8724_t:CDS:1 n=1 Tax=Paraglomus occultum TaxID=144539 RepID=A0A9N9BBZ8_9GLOM|nr:8724_t:CDS:10 [Paraglomus occultum]